MRTRFKLTAIVLSTLLLCGLIQMDTIPGERRHLISGVAAEQGEILDEAESPSETVIIVNNDESKEPERPAETERPVATERPAETEKPVATERPLETEQPIETENPIQETEKPIETEVPAEEINAGFEEENPGDIGMEVLGPCDMKLGGYEIPSATPGGTLAIAVPIYYIRGEITYHSNAGPNGGTIPYRPGHSQADYDQAIAQVLQEARVMVLETQDGDFPLTSDILSQERRVISGGSNNGYAVFENVQVSENAEPGMYPVQLQVVWKDIAGERQSKALTVIICVMESVIDEAELQKADEEEEEPEDTLLEPADVVLGHYATPSAGAGENLTLAFPIRYMRGSLIFSTNAGPYGDIIPYDGQAADFDQVPNDELGELRITIAAEQAEDFPLDWVVLAQSRTIISNGVNNGYAVFENVRISEDAEPGLYPIRLQVTWRDADGAFYVKECVGMIEVMESTEREPGDVALGNYAMPSAEAGETLTLAIPIRYTREGLVLSTNAGPNGDIIPYGNPAASFGQALKDELAELSVTIAAWQAEDFPLDLEVLFENRMIVSNGENIGYAVFENVLVSEDAEPGLYPIRILVTWTDLDGGTYVKECDGMIEVIEPAEREPGDVALGDYEMPSTEAGGSIDLALPIRYTRDEWVYNTNESTQGGMLSYEETLSPEDYDQSVTVEIVELYVAIANEQAEDCPIDPEALSGQQTIITDGKNMGFAAFADLSVMEDVEPGEYPVLLNVSWLEADSEQWQTKTLTAFIGVMMDALESDGVALGACPPFEAAPGDEKITLAIPITYKMLLNEYNEELDEYEVVEEKYDTNANTNEPEDVANGLKSIIPYDGGGYDQDMITGLLSELSITISDTQATNCPLDITNPLAAQALITGGVNNGYAVFEDVPLVEELTMGVYPVSLSVAWQTMDGDARTEVLTVYVNVTLGDIMLYGENGAIAFTHTQLQNLLETTQYDPIYLGCCDTNMPAGSWETRNDGVIRYPSDASARIAVSRSVTIIGTDPRNQKRIKVIDRATAASDSVNYSNAGIYANTAGITITVRDVTWEGHNGNGIVCGYRQCGAQFINVNYTGSRMYASDTSGSWVSFTNCSAYITDLGGSENGQEVAKCGDIRLYGTNNITRDGTVNGIWYAVFWVNVSPNKVTVAAGANVTINTNNYVFRLPNSSSATLDVEGQLDVTTNGNNGCINYGTEYFNVMSIAGSLSIVHNGGSYGSLRAKTLTVTGSLDITKQANDRPCVAIIAGGSANFNSPKHASLSNASGYLMRAADGVSSSLSITTQVINRWTSSTKYIWNNNDLSPFTVSASMASGTSSSTTVNSVTGLVNNKGAALQAPTLNTANFALLSSTRLEFGQYASMSIDADTVYIGSETVKGTAPGGSTVREYEYVNGTLGQMIQSTTAVGSFQTGGDWNPIASNNSRVYVLSSYNNLEAHIYADCKEVCFLYDIPPILDFGTVAVSGHEQLVERLMTDWTIQIVDTRESGTWRLSASAEALRSSDGPDTLPTALVFVQPDGNMLPLSTGSSVMVAEKSATDIPGITDLVWPQDEGLLVSLNPYEGIADEHYNTTITWTLEMT